MDILNGVGSSSTATGVFEIVAFRGVEKALGLTVSPALLARADQVIE